MRVQLWAIAAYFLVLWVLFARCSYAGASLPYFAPDMGLIRLLMFHTSLAQWLRLRSRHWTACFPRSRQLSGPWPRPRRLVTGVSAFGIGRPAFPAVDCYLARLTRRRTAAGGDASAAWLRLLSLSLLFGPEFGFCTSRTTVKVVLARSPGCPSRLGSRGFLSLQITFPMK